MKKFIEYKKWRGQFQNTIGLFQKLVIDQLTFEYVDAFNVFYKSFNWNADKKKRDPPKKNRVFSNHHRYLRKSVFSRIYSEYFKNTKT